MKNFFNFMRHTQLINFKIIVYSCKEIGGILKGKKLKPSLSPKKIQEYIDDFQKGNEIKSLPMGPYEYDCCVEYLKMLRKELFKNRKDFSMITLRFGPNLKYGVTEVPAEDCLIKVAKEVGFDFSEERLLALNSEYDFKSSFFEDAA